MPNGAAPRNMIHDPVSGVIALDINVGHLRAAHLELKQDVQRNGDAARVAFQAHINDDNAFRAEVWKRVGHLENLKFWVMGAGFIIGVAFALANFFGSKNVQGRVSGIVTAQSEADRSYIDAKFDGLVKALQQREVSHPRPEDVPQVGAVRRRR